MTNYWQVIEAPPASRFQLSSYYWSLMLALSKLGRD